MSLVYQALKMDAKTFGDYKRNLKGPDSLDGAIAQYFSPKSKEKYFGGRMKNVVFDGSNNSVRFSLEPCFHSADGKELDIEGVIYIVKKYDELFQKNVAFPPTDHSFPSGQEGEYMVLYLENK